MNDPNVRNATAEDYVEIYEDPWHKHEMQYGTQGHYHFYEDKLRTALTGAISVVDLGTGSGGYLEWLADNIDSCRTAVGIDRALPPIISSKRGCVMQRHQMTWDQYLTGPAAVADWVCSFDFLEHLEPDDVPRCLRACWEHSATGMAHTWAMISTVHRVNGKLLELHPTVRPWQWWRDLFREVCGPDAEIEYTEARGNQPEWRGGMIAWKR